MSAFSVVDFWKTKCGGEDESFSFYCMHVLEIKSFDHVENVDVGKLIIIGSLSGFLRVYQISGDDKRKSGQTGFRPSDLLLETLLPSPVLQVTSGKLVSGSRDSHICIVHPLSISVYSLSIITGSAEHGTFADLKILYEQPVQHVNYQVIVGPFGGVNGRDFVCILSIDGTLTFFEQETFAFETKFPKFINPFPMVYIQETDIFVTLSSDWCIEAYNYHSLVESKQRASPPSLWSYNLGESLLDIQTTKLKVANKEEPVIVTLSNRNITCINDKGLLKFVKRLQFNPICFLVYPHNDRCTFQSYVTIDVVYAHIVLSNLEATVVICYIEDEMPQLISKTATIPAQFVLALKCVEVLDSWFRLNILANKALPPINTIFQEFHTNPNNTSSEDGSYDTGFILSYNPQMQCNITFLKDKFGLIIASNSIPMMYLILSQLTTRSMKIYKLQMGNKNVTNNDIAFEYTEKIPKRFLLNAIRDYMEIKNNISQLKTLLENLGAQYRLIQRRLLIKLKDKIPSELSSIQILYQCTYQKIIDIISEIEAKEKVSIEKSCVLHATLNLVLDLMLMVKDVSSEQIHKIRKCINFTPGDISEEWHKRTIDNLTFTFCSSMPLCFTANRMQTLSNGDIMDSCENLHNIVEGVINNVLGIHKDDKTEDKECKTIALPDTLARGVSPIMEVEEN